MVWNSLLQFPAWTLSDLLIPWFLAAVCTSSMPLFSSPVRTVEQCSARRHLTVTHTNLCSHGSPAVRAPLVHAQLLHSYEYLLTPNTKELEQVEARYLVPRLIPSSEREFRPTGSSTGSTPSLSVTRVHEKHGTICSNNANLKQSVRAVRVFSLSWEKKHLFSLKS